jgi:anti-sigma28 factor (negative regulator of flagellin synthesis)
MTDKGSRPDPGISPVRSELMEENRKMRLAELQHRIGRGEYVVDVRAVAEAIVRRLQQHAAKRL